MCKAVHKLLLLPLPSYFVVLYLIESVTLFNKTLSIGLISTEWKEGNVILIH